MNNEPATVTSSRSTHVDRTSAVPLSHERGGGGSTCALLACCEGYSCVGDLDEALIRPNPCSRKTLEHFVYDFFLARIGNRMLAEVHLAALYSSIVRLRTESRKIYMFGRLLGIFDAIPQVQLPIGSRRLVRIACTFIGTLHGCAGRR